MDFNNDQKFLAALSHFPKFGATKLKKLNRYFPSFQEAFQANLNNLKQAGIEENIANEFIIARAKLNPEEIDEKLSLEKIKIITIKDDLYPKLLKEILDAPFLLYYKGELKKDESLALAVVGSRLMTSYGKLVVEKIIPGLKASGLTIVSGLALGIDALAHESALENNLRTVAVLGTGLDQKSLYPAQNNYLADKIIANNGALLSEFPLGTKPLKINFPQRNRIVAGLSLGTLVIEANERSGALITAKMALDYNREVFAIPGNINSLSSRGPNNLLKEGARLVTSAQDITETLNLGQLKIFETNKKTLPTTQEESIIFNILQNEIKHINDLVRLSSLDTSKINATLIVMEMKGIIQNMGNGHYGIK